MPERALSMNEPTSYYGLFSENQRLLLVSLLDRLGVRYEFVQVAESLERLREWTALDESSATSLVGFELFIRSEDVELVGTKLVELFPSRTFGAS